MNHRSQAQKADGQEPDHHDGAEDLADDGRALALQHEQPHQDDHSRGQDVLGKARHRLFEAFQRGQHRNRRRDRTIAIQQSRTQNAHGHQASAFMPMQGQIGHQGQNSAFALVVGAHDQGHILDRSRQDQGPDDEGEHAEGDLGRGPTCGLHGGLKGVKRAGADVTKHHAQRAQHQSTQGPVNGVLNRARSGGGGIHANRLQNSNAAVATTCHCPFTSVVQARTLLCFAAFCMGMRRFQAPPPLHPSCRKATPVARRLTPRPSSGKQMGLFSRLGPLTHRYRASLAAPS